MSKKAVSKTIPAVLVLADGTVFHGIAIGAVGHTVGEVVFNTSMTGNSQVYMLSLKLKSVSAIIR